MQGFGRSLTVTKAAVASLVVLAFAAHGATVVLFDQFVMQLSPGGDFLEARDWAFFAGLARTARDIAIGLGFVFIAVSLFRGYPQVPQPLYRSAGIGLVVTAAAMLIAYSSWAALPPGTLDLGFRESFALVGILGFWTPILLLGVTLLTVPWGSPNPEVSPAPFVPATPSVRPDGRNP